MPAIAVTRRRTSDGAMCRVRPAPAGDDSDDSIVVANSVVAGSRSHRGLMRPAMTTFGVKHRWPAERRPDSNVGVDAIRWRDLGGHRDGLIRLFAGLVQPRLRAIRPCPTTRQPAHRQARELATSIGESALRAQCGGRRCALSRTKRASASRSPTASQAERAHIGGVSRETSTDEIAHELARANNRSILDRNRRIRVDRRRRRLSL